MERQGEHKSMIIILLIFNLFSSLSCRREKKKVVDDNDFARTLCGKGSSSCGLDATSHHSKAQGATTTNCDVDFHIVPVPLIFCLSKFLVRPNLKRISIDNCRLESIDGTI